MAYLPIAARSLLRRRVRLPRLLPEMPELTQPAPGRSPGAGQKAKRRNWKLDPFWLEKAWKLGSRS